MHRVALTGGIASGKSTATECFAELGIPVIDTDRIARELTAPGTPLTRRICAEFGDAICAPDGSLERRAMRRRIFANPGLRRQLEQLLHPAIADAMEEEIAALQTASPYVLLVIPLLFEAGWENRVDRIVVVDCSPQVQLERLRRRDRITEELAEQMLASQVSREKRLAAADFVLHNSVDTSIAMLQKQVRELDRQLTGVVPD